MLFQIMRGIRLFLKLNYVLSTYPNISIIAFGPTVLICVITSGLPPLFNAYRYSFWLYQAHCICDALRPNINTKATDIFFRREDDI